MHGGGAAVNGGRGRDDGQPPIFRQNPPHIHAVRRMHARPRLDRTGYIVGDAPAPGRKFLADIVSGPLTWTSSTTSTVTAMPPACAWWWTWIAQRRGGAPRRRRAPPRDPRHRAPGAVHVLEDDAVRHWVPPPQGQGLRLPVGESAIRAGTGRLSGLCHVVDYLDRSDAAVLEDDATGWMRGLRFRDLPYRAAVR